MTPRSFLLLSALPLVALIAGCASDRVTVDQSPPYRFVRFEHRPAMGMTEAVVFELRHPERNVHRVPEDVLVRSVTDRHAQSPQPPEGQRRFSGHLFTADSRTITATIVEQVEERTIPTFMIQQAVAFSIDPALGQAARTR